MRYGLPTPTDTICPPRVSSYLDDHINAHTVVFTGDYGVPRDASAPD